MKPAFTDVHHFLFSERETEKRRNGERNGRFFPKIQIFSGRKVNVKWKIRKLERAANTGL